MAQLGFSIDSDFAPRTAQRRRGLGGKINDVDSLIKTKDRAGVEIYVGLALFGIFVAIMAWPDEAATLLRHLAVLR
jgi:hypothetical protein